MQATLSRQFTLPFIKKIQEARDTWTFFFDRSVLKENYDFLPGQYNRVTLQIEVKDNRGNNRQFTISSSPTDKNFLTITTKILEKRSDFKSAFFNLKEKTEVQFFGPLGGFVLKEEDKTPRVFLAGGIGITPFHSMTKYVADKNLEIPITLIDSFSIPEDFIFYKELSDISSSHKNIKVIYSVSHPEDSKTSWNGEVGRISENIIQKYIPDLQIPIFLVVGPPPMVDSTVELLQNLKIPEEHIKVEHFTGY